MKLGLMLQVGHGGAGRGPNPALVRHPGDGAGGRGDRIRCALRARSSALSQIAFGQHHPGGDAGRGDQWNVGGLDGARRARGGDAAHRAGPPRCLQQLPQPGPAREDGSHPGRGERGPSRAGHSARAGTSRSITRSASLSTGRWGGLEEALQIISALLRKGRVDFSGALLLGPRLRDYAPADPRPEGPPILVGGQRPRMLRLAANLRGTSTTPTSTSARRR